MHILVNRVPVSLGLLRVFKVQLVPTNLALTCAKTSQPCSKHLFSGLLIADTSATQSLRNTGNVVPFDRIKRIGAILCLNTLHDTIRGSLRYVLVDLFAKAHVVKRLEQLHVGNKPPRYAFFQ